MEIVAWDLARTLVRKGHDVRILTTQCDGLPEQSIQERVSIECLPAPSGRYSRAWWTLSQVAFKQRLASQTDIVLSISGGAKAIARGRERGQKPYFVVQAHGTAWSDGISKLRSTNPVNWIKAAAKLKSVYDDRSYRFFDSFVAVGEAVKTNLLSKPSRWVIGNIPVEVIHNGINTEAFLFDDVKRRKTREQLELMSDDQVVISFSRLHAQKGILESLTAFERAAAKNPSLRYIVIGSGPLEQNLKEIVRSRGLERVVQILGFVPHELLPSYLSAADIFLFTTICIEGFPLSVMESLAAGLPCIVSNHVSNPLWGTIGVEPRDAEAIAGELLKLSNAPVADRKSRLPLQYSLDVVTENYIEHFERLNRDGTK